MSSSGSKNNDGHTLSKLTDALGRLIFPLPRPFQSPVPHLLTTNSLPSDEEVAIIQRFIEAKEKRLNILKGPASLVKLYSQAIDEHKAVLGPFRRVPVELWTLILPLASDSPHPSFQCKDIRCLMSVCHQWRQILLSIPSIWAHIQISLATAVRSPGFLDFLRILLERSQGRPLRLRLKTTYCGPDPAYFPALKMLADESHRWQHIDFTTSFPILRIHFSSIQNRIPLLESLRLSIDAQPDGPDLVPCNFFQNAPRLTSVDVSSIHASFIMQRFPLMAFPWPQLVHLSGGKSVPWLCPSPFVSHEHLRHLVISITNTFPVMQRNSSGWIHLPCLTYLAVQSGERLEGGRFFEFLCAPALEELHVNKLPRTLTPMIQRSASWTVSSPSSSSGTLEGQAGSASAGVSESSIRVLDLGRAEYYSADTLRELLTALPNLTHFAGHINYMYTLMPLSLLPESVTLTVLPIEGLYRPFVAKLASPGPADAGEAPSRTKNVVVIFPTNHHTHEEVEHLNYEWMENRWRAAASEGTGDERLALNLGIVGNMKAHTKVLNAEFPNLSNWALAKVRRTFQQLEEQAPTIDDMRYFHKSCIHHAVHRVATMPVNNIPARFEATDNFRRRSRAILDLWMPLFSAHMADRQWVHSGHSVRYIGNDDRSVLSRDPVDLFFGGVRWDGE